MPVLSRRQLLVAGTAWLLPAVIAPRDPSEPGPGTRRGAREELTQLEREDPDRLLAVVSKTRPVEPLDYVPDDLVQWRNSSFELRAEVVDQLELLMTAADEAGHELRVVSGYRSYRTQAGTFDYWAAKEGAEAADRISARPGHSEHQTGLAVDLDGPGGCYLDACFGSTPAGVWLAAECHRFGFVLSYPEGLEERSGFDYEPWHFRYVGRVAARRMRELGIELLTDYRPATLVPRYQGSLAPLPVQLG